MAANLRRWRRNSMINCQKRQDVVRHDAAVAVVVTEA